MSSLRNLSLSRRRFLGATVGAGGLILGFTLPGFSREQQAISSSALPTGEEKLNAFIAIDSQGIVTMQMPFIEMGQGTYTSLPMLIAEELDVDLSAVRPVQADHGPDYRIMFNNTVRYTGSSSSVRTAWMPLRTAGATARAMLMAAAAQHWGVNGASLRTDNGSVLNPTNGEKLSYGELSPLAAGLTPPDDVALKDPSQYKLLGKSVDRTDVIGKSNGTAEFGFDIQMDGLKIALVKQCPVHRGNVKSYNPESVIQMSGVFSVDEIPNGIAVVGKSYWHAKRALDALSLEFEPGELANFNSSDYASKLLARIKDAGEHAEDKGDVDAALQDAASVIEASYQLPYLAHATMEPMSSTALVTDNQCTLWTPNQGADRVAQTAAQITGLPLERIMIHTPFLGGGFGRRFLSDFVAQAVTLAMKYKGTPIKVLWPREEDMQHDFYRPMLAAHYRAAFDKENNPTAIFITNVGDGPFRQLAPEFMQNPKLDHSVVEGTFHQPYNISNWRADYVYEHSPAPVGFWRSVGNSYNGFCKESFIDEMAHAVDKDPVQFRRDLLVNAPRHLAILNYAADMAQWPRSTWHADDRRTHAMGVALHESFGTIVAQVAEVSLDDAQLLRIHKVWCAVDCGFTVNPKIATMQMESAIAYGLSAMLYEEITINNGATVNGNFDDYRILTAQQMPDVEVGFINSGAAIGGIGEPGTPPIAPAVCNALFTLTGQRIRSLPLRKHNFA
jgi:isoquinoline 1-oxidoreductase beta subunit